MLFAINNEPAQVVSYWGHVLRAAGAVHTSSGFRAAPMPRRVRLSSWWSPRAAR